MAAIFPRGRWSASRALAPVPSLLAATFLIDLGITNVLDGRPETTQAREAKPFGRGHTAAQGQCWPRTQFDSQSSPSEPYPVPQRRVSAFPESSTKTSISCVWLSGVTGAVSHFGDEVPPLIWFRSKGWGEACRQGAIYMLRQGLRPSCPATHT